MNVELTGEEASLVVGIMFGWRFFAKPSDEEIALSESIIDKITAEDKKALDKIIGKEGLKLEPAAIKSQITRAMGEFICWYCGQPMELDEEMKRLVRSGELRMPSHVMCPPQGRPERYPR